MFYSPHKVGEEALTEGIPCREETGWPLGEMVVVVVVVVVVVESYYFFINNYC